ncbi:pro-neuregulin-3, membrane-bound isoform-like [Polyodon spathula]|uniref:pro-neuregulin-3, membrane-bound isoform-like n=1 Tax=Polyodon spathula TaxID=7913 RepID=UPI001B7DB4FF|nr:pro-neuregulin-3, membrane-bound isoform-like [Polyodon spathula]
MSEAVAAAVSGAAISEDPEGAAEGSEQPSPPEPGPLRCGSCALWPRQQTWLCVVPLLIGFIGLGLSLMLLKWIVVGSVKDYVPTDLVDAKGIGQDPIFLSKPSTFPKNSETTTATITVSSRTRPGLGSHSTTTASSAGEVVPAGSGSFTPRAPNRISTRITTTTTTRAPRLLPPGGRGVTPRGTTVRRVTTGTSARMESAVPTAAVTPTMEARQEPTVLPSPSPSGRFYLHDSTAVWTLGHFPAESSPAVPTRPPLRTKTHAPTSSPERSEHFKPCRDKDLAYCLNEGECFVIETLTGSHKHCRCKEGYQGVRCDQFLPKTDSILSDPTDHLGIEFMESKEVYQRQVLSISCITIGISLLGTLCVAFYCRNKRRKEKLQAHLKESQSLKSYSLNTSSLMSKSTFRPQSYCKAPVPFPALGGSVHESSFSHGGGTRFTGGRSPNTRISQRVKQHRSSSLSHSPDQQSQATHRLAPRKTTPPPRGRLNPIGGAKDSGPAYQHLQEAEPSEKEAVQEGHYSVSGTPPLHPQDFLNMQPPLCASTAGAGGDKPELQCSLDPQKAWSTPIIPSVQGPDDPSCMQTSRERRGRSCASAPGSSALSLSSVRSPAALPPTGQQQEVALLLHTAHEQLRVLAQAHRKCEDCSPVLPASFMSPAIRGGGVVKPTPAETQLVHPRGPHRDNSPSCQ